LAKNLLKIFQIKKWWIEILMNYDQWIEKISGGIIFQCDEGPKDLRTDYDILDEDYEEE
jgi:hypothetical protein